MAPADPTLASASKLAARAARFTTQLPGNRYKELEELRQNERKEFEKMGLIKVGKTELEDAVEMRGTCEKMCNDYEREFREFTREVHPFEATPDKRMDPAKAVAAYSRSDAGAGHGDSAILPSDLRTPLTLVQTLDYLFSVIMPTPPPSTSSLPAAVSQRKALGYSAGFIRDRTRAIRKEFAMQSSWGHDEAIASFERIARWHILCLRELQEEGGTNNDMHIDSAELGRCFTSLRQHYNDRREELGTEVPCPNEPEFRAYMLVYDLANKSVSIPTSELPSSILDHPLVKLAWDIRKCAQRNFDSQKEGSKLNAERGANMISRYIKLLEQGKVPYLLGCLVEIRLRDMRRSALRALNRAYPRLRTEPIRLGESGEIVERKMIIIPTLAKLLGCAPQDPDPSAWDDVPSTSLSPSDECVAICEKFNIPIYRDPSGEPVGALVNLGTAFDDNRDAPYTRRWESVSNKRKGTSFADIVNGVVGVGIDGQAAAAPSRAQSSDQRPVGAKMPAFSFGAPKPALAPAPVPSAAFSFKAAQPAVPAAEKPAISAFGGTSSANTPFSFSKPSSPAVSPFVALPLQSADKEEPSPKAIPNFFGISSTPRASESSGPSSSISPSTSAKTMEPSKPALFSFGLPTSGEGKQEDSREKTKRSAEEGPSSKKSMFTFEAPKQRSPVSVTPLPSANAPSTEAAPGSSVAPFSFSLPPVASASVSSIPAAVDTPKEIKPLPLKQNPSLLLSTSTAPRLLKTVSKPLSTIHTERLARKAALPQVCDELLASAMQQLLEKHLAVEVESLVEQQIAEREYAQRKAWRKSLIAQWSEAVWEKMVEEEVWRLARQPIVREIRRRILLRRVVAHWRKFTQESVERKNKGKGKREGIAQELRAMGLSRSFSEVVGGASSGQVSAMSSLGSIGGFGSDVEMASVSDIMRLDSLAIDVQIIQAERNKDNFFAPSTFLRSVAHHVYPHLQSIYPPFTCSFTTLLSAPPRESESFGSPPDSQVQDWLESKLAPPKTFVTSGETPALDGFAMGGVEFDTVVVSDGESQRRDGWTGLVVFEAPVRTGDDRKAAENLSSAQDRMGSLVKLLEDSTNRYYPSLIILVWEDETLEDLVERLQIQDETSAFKNRTLVSLEVSDDLDRRFQKALEDVLEDVEIKEQVVVRLHDAIEAVHFAWEQYTEVAGIILSQQPRNLSVPWTIFSSGCELINSIPKICRDAVGPRGLEDEISFRPVILPEVNVASPNSLDDMVERMALYFEDEVIAGVDDLDMLLTTLSQAVQFNLTLPIIPILQALSFFVLGELQHQNLYTQTYFSRESGTEDWMRDYMRGVTTEFERSVEKKIQQITRIITPLDYPSQRSPKTSPGTVKTLGKKRSRTENDGVPHMEKGKKKESKAAKAAKLLRAMKRAERSLNGV